MMCIIIINHYKYLANVEIVEYDFALVSNAKLNCIRNAWIRLWKHHLLPPRSDESLIQKNYYSVHLPIFQMFCRTFEFERLDTSNYLLRLCPYLITLGYREFSYRSHRSNDWREVIISPNWKSSIKVLQGTRFNIQDSL